MIITYQMRSVGYYFRNQVLATFYDAFKAHDWEAAITAVKTQEDILRNDADDYDRKQIRRHASETQKFLHEIEELTKSLEDQVKRYFPQMASDMSRLVELKKAEAVKEKKEEEAEHDQYIAAFLLYSIRREDYADMYELMTIPNESAQAWSWFLEHARFTTWRPGLVLVLANDSQKT